MKDIPKEFWQEYIKLDYFEQKDKLKTLPFIKDFPKIVNDLKDKPDVMEYLLVGTIQDYINDILRVIK
jgi:hypothetical protein